MNSKIVIWNQAQPPRLVLTLKIQALKSHRKLRFGQSLSHVLKWVYDPAPHTVDLGENASMQPNSCSHQEKYLDNKFMLKNQIQKIYRTHTYRTYIVTLKVTLPVGLQLMFFGICQKLRQHLLGLVQVLWTAQRLYYTRGPEPIRPSFPQAELLLEFE